MLSKENLKKITNGKVSGETISTYLPFLEKYMIEYEINTKLRIAAFIAQLLHESGNFKYVKELASGDAYDTRTDLGNTPEKDGDGRKFKGRGLIQITGKFNYQALSKDFKIDLIKNPELLETPDLAVRSACWFWKGKKLNLLADKSDFKLITKRINGGLNG